MQEDGVESILSENSRFQKSGLRTRVGCSYRKGRRVRLNKCIQHIDATLSGAETSNIFNTIDHPGWTDVLPCVSFVFGGGILQPPPLLVRRLVVPVLK